MDQERVVFVRCKLSRGNTSADRIFRIDAPGGGDLYGSAPLHYCYTPARTRLKPTEATTNNETEGMVVGVQIREVPGGLTRVHMPNGDIYEVSESLVDSVEAASVPK